MVSPLIWLLNDNEDEMPIYEYSCNDCGTRFEKLLRRMEESNTLTCPSCGEDHLTEQYSTFAAHGGSTSQKPEPGGSCASMPSGGCCGGGMCGMNFN